MSQPKISKSTIFLFSLLGASFLFFDEFHMFIAFLFCIFLVQRGNKPSVS